MMIRRAALSNCETKFITNNYSTSLRHNRWLTNNPLAGIIQGTSQHRASGEEIFIKGFRVAINVSNFGVAVSQSAPSTFIFALVRTREEITQSTVGDQDIATYKEFVGNVIIDKFDTDRHKIMKVWKKRMVPQHSVQNIDVQLQTYIPLNKRFKFKTQLPTSGTDATYGKYYNYYIIGGAHVSGGTPSVTTYTTNIQITTYFKDP